MQLRWLCALAVLLAAVAAEEKWSGDYVLVLPKALRPTAMSTISVNIQSKNVAMSINSIDPQNKRKVTSAVSIFPTGNGVVNYRLPFANYRRKTVKLAFTAWSCENDIKNCTRGPRLFYVEATFPILQDPLLIFTETNKPIYKPGEWVRFRVLPLLAESLQPTQIVSGKQRDLTFDIIYLEAPGKVRVAQWRNVSWTEALNVSYQLSADPLFGTWKIVTRIKDAKDVETFKVKKYVLPRFTVTVKPPPYIYVGDSTVKFSVCAKYTTNQPIKAKVRAELCLRNDRYRRRRNNLKRLCLRVEKVLNGSRECIDFKESTKVLQLQNRFGYRNVKIFVNATVIENGTGETVIKQEFGGPLEVTPFKIVKRFANTFRPGLPFYGQLQTINHDGSPIANLKVACRVVSWMGRYWGYSEVLTSDASGIVNFGIPPFPSSASSVTLLFKSVASPSSKNVSSNTLPASVTLREIIARVYSPSNTYVQVYPLDRLPPQKPCSAGKLSVLLQSNVMLFNKTIYALSIARGNVQATTLFKSTTDLADKCEDQDNLAIGHYTCVMQKDGTYKIRCLRGWKGPNCKTAICKDGCLQGVCRIPGKCACKRGWSGLACNKCITRKGCFRGYCLYGNDCRCYSYYRGYLCDRTYIGWQRRNRRPTWRTKPSAADLNPVKPFKKEPEYDPESTLEDLSFFTRQVDIPITPELYPASKIVIWFTYEASGRKRELVVTSVSLDNLQDCLSKSTPTSFAFDKKTVRPGEKVTASIKTSGVAPKCALAISDVALEAFGARGGLSESSLAAEIEKTVSQMQEEHPNDPYNNLKENFCDRRWRQRGLDAKRVKRTVMPSDSTSKDSSFFFNDAGAFVISNIPVMTAPCDEPLFMMSAMEDSFRENFEIDAPMASFGRKLALSRKGFSGSEKKKAKTKKLKKKIKARVRSFFIENWKFEVLDDPKTSLSLEVPDSMTTWKSTMYCVSSKGVGLSLPDRLVVFQPFFLQMALPYSLKRGETAQIPVKVFSYRKECSEIILTMEPSKQLETNGLQSVSACLCNFDQLTAYFRVRPNKLGKVPIKVEAWSRASDRCQNPQGSSLVEEVADAVLRQLLVEAEGMPEEMSFGDLLCPAGKLVTTTFEITAPNKTGFAIAEGSERAYFMWSGNVIGPAMENLDNMVKMPYGCGEQNMISMVPSIYVLDYLNKTGAEKPQEKALMEKAQKFIVIGYQRELRYRLYDGSFSAFGKRDKVGSTWLTAFVFKSFVAATKYVEIDRQVLSQALDFLLSKTGKRGCFREDGRIIHTEMQGGQGGAKDEVAITVYILGALLEANEADPGLKSTTAPGIEAAVRCLRATTTETALMKISNYGIALRAYALTKWSAAHNLAQRYQVELQRRRSFKDNFSFWRGKTDEAARTFARPWSRFVAADVETTAYALLSLLAGTEQLSNTLLEVLPSLRWLASLRNERGGWFSTQDSLLALQVFSDFAKYTSGSGKDTELSVTIESREGRHEATVTSANKLVLSKMAISVPNSLKVTIKGDGCLAAQANVLFNVKDTGRAGAPFSLWANANHRAGSCDRAEMLVCVRYTGSSDQSGMAVVKVRMASGWQATKASIDALNENVTKSSLKMIEVDSEKTLVLYFDSFTATNSCVTFAVQRDIEVAGVKPMLIQVYDYYKPHETQERSVQVVGKACEKPLGDAPAPGCPLCTVMNDTAERAVKRLCAKPHIYASMELQDKPGIMLYIHQVGDVIKMWNAAVKLPKGCRCNITGETIIAVPTRPRSFSMDEAVALDGDWTVINVNSLSAKGHKKLGESCAKKSEGFSVVYNMFMQRKSTREKWEAKMKKKREEMEKMAAKMKKKEKEDQKRTEKQERKTENRDEIKKNVKPEKKSEATSG